MFCFLTYLLTAMRFVSRSSLAAGGKALRRWYAAEGPRRPSTESVRPHPLQSQSPSQINLMVSVDVKHHCFAMRFDHSLFTHRCEKEDPRKRHKGFKFGTSLLVVFKCHHGSERVKHKHRKHKYWFHEASQRWPLNRSFFKRQRRRNRRADTTANKRGGVKQ